MDRIVKDGYKPLMREKSKRAWELDFLRGLAVICMCFDHLMYDLTYYRGWFINAYSVDAPFLDKLSELARSYWHTGFYNNAGLRFFGHHIFVFVFLFIVGTSCAFSRSNSQRGSKLAIVAIAFTGVSFALKALGIMDFGIVFGILHCIALSVIIAAGIDLITSFNKWVNLFVPLALGIIIVSVGLSKSFWTVRYDPAFEWDRFFDYMLGRRGFGDDWFGLFPNIGAVLMGMYWGKAAYPQRRSLIPALDRGWNKPVCFVGRHALIFYLAHQVAIAGVLILVCVIAGFRLW